ncbi:MAG: hypothetical protein AAGM84_04510 [Pseudomonadota bacterium]
MIRHFARMRYVLAFLLLAACNTASPGFRGIDATRITIDGSTFDVRVRELRAEAIRINAEYAPRFGPIEGRAARAMAQVSGCRVARVSGDQALAFGALDCGGGAPPMRYKGHVEIECFPIGGLAPEARHPDVQYNCTPI